VTAFQIGFLIGGLSGFVAGMVVVAAYLAGWWGDRP
jgi:hypothetical protein